MSSESSPRPPPRRRAARGDNAPATVADVARESGVSPMTVSRVVNGEAGVRPATREAVRAAIARLGYRPNAAARLLAGGAPVRVALLHADPDAGQLGALLTGGLAAADRLDASFVAMQRALDETIAAMAQRLAARGIDGVVLPPPLCDDAGLRAALGAAGLAMVLVAPDAPPADALAVAIEDRAAAAEMTAHLIGRGHRRIGFVTGDLRRTAGARRLAGYRAALAEAGIAFDPALVATGDLSYRAGLAAADALLGLRWPPSAIFASSDAMAAAAVAVAHRRRLAVPRDLAVAGFDDGVIATTIWPALTTVRQPVALMAAAAVELLIDAVRRRRAQQPPVVEHRRFDHALIERGSTTPSA